MLLRAQPINFDLKNENEKESTIYQFQSVLNSLKFPIQIVIQSRRVDLSNYISKLDKIVANESNELLKDMGSEYVEFIKVLSGEINIMEKNFFIIVGHTAKGVVEKETIIDKILKKKNTSPTTFSDADFEEYKNILLEKVRTVAGRLSSLGVTTEVLDTKGIIELLYNTYNPEEAITEHIKDTGEMTTSVIDRSPHGGVINELTQNGPPMAPVAQATTLPTTSPTPVQGQEVNPAKPAQETIAAPKAVQKSSMEQILGKLGISHDDPNSPEAIFQKGLTTVLDIISPSGLKVSPTFLQLGSFYVRTLFVYTYPRYLEANWLSPIINMDTAYDMTMFIYPSETSYLLGQLRRKTTQLQSSQQVEQEKGLVRNPELDTAIEDIEELRDTLQKGQTRLFQMGLYLTIYSETIEELNKLSKTVESMLNSTLTYSKQSFFQMEQGFNSTLPLLDDQLDTARNFDTGSLSTIFPFTSAELSHHEGVMYGINLHNNSLVLFERFRMENANMVVFAKSGAGKSYAVKLEALRQLMLGTEIIVIDPENEFKKFSESVGGSYVSLSLNSSQKINPFDLPKLREGSDDTAEQILRSTITSIHGLVSLMVGGLSPEEDSLLDKALYETYALKDITVDPATHNNTPPLLSDLAAVLRNMNGTESLVNRMSKFTDGSFSNIFNSQTNIDINNKVTVFSIRDMEDELRPLAMYLALNFIWAKVKSVIKKRFLLIDEGWIMMRFEDSAKFVSAMTKRARKYYLGVTLISQDVEDVLTSTYGRSIVNNSSTQLLLGQSSSAIDKISETFKLTDGEKFFLTEAEKGQGLIFAGNNHAAIQIVASYVEDQIITTDPKQLEEIYGTSQAQNG